jgi:hypothetical protein
VYLHGAP